MQKDGMQKDGMQKDGMQRGCCEQVQEQELDQLDRSRQHALSTPSLTVGEGVAAGALDAEQRHNVARRLQLDKYKWEIKSRGGR